ncbi:NAD(P)H-dependent oxidoreductase [Litoribacter ruber]|uniref:NAD(P)H-dependent oxidoreductase n=1 Tax=Litoribacter ruber TaxID=702568 RepID=A0AAP2G4E0_9BACT|nr:MULTISPECIES: NAD(P)H-dependent oxidoreductase [Litoribacter]MBS9523956.1 NAD(P)H-dependent oxidoreductase [Litoribacter alkaliphilus]MBT0811449.1 NAD(P)H-dependent oxidoreductase [Litoribacter ruber]
MIKIIVSTNRRNSISSQIAQQYLEILQDLNQEAEIIDLMDLPNDFIFTALYEHNGKNKEYNRVHNQVKEGMKFVFIVPEYNGSFPGILKSFIDGMSYPNTFRNKKCALVGLSSGIGGGGIALSHLTDIFHYLGMHVLANKPKLAKIEENMSDNLLTNRFYIDLLQTQAEMLIDF